MKIATLNVTITIDANIHKMDTNAFHAHSGFVLLNFYSIEMTSIVQIDHRHRTRVSSLSLSIEINFISTTTTTTHWKNTAYVDCYFHMRWADGLIKTFFTFAHFHGCSLDFAYFANMHAHMLILICVYISHRFEHLLLQQIYEGERENNKSNLAKFYSISFFMRLICWIEATIKR